MDLELTTRGFCVIIGSLHQRTIQWFEFSSVLDCSTKSMFYELKTLRYIHVDSDLFGLYVITPRMRLDQYRKYLIIRQSIVVLDFNTFRLRQNGRHFTDDIFKRIFFNENVWIAIKNSLKFVHKGPIYNIPALVQIMAWRRPGDKPLSETMMNSLPTHICITRPQWVKK